MAKNRCLTMVNATVMALLCFAAAVATGCIRALPGEPPPDGARLYYPGRMALSADGHTAFVVNLNFDQRFNTSWLTRIDVRDLIARAQRAQDVSPAIIQSVHVPSLGGDLIFAPNQNRAYLSHRGAGLLTVLDSQTDAAGNTVLSCGTPNPSEALGHFEAHTDCDLQHLMRLKQAVLAQDGNSTDPNHRQYDDPYALTALPQNGNSTSLLVGFLEAGRISALTDYGKGLPIVQGYIKTPARGVARLISTPEGMVFAASRASNARGFDAAASKSYVIAVDLHDAETGANTLLGTNAKGGLAAQSFILSHALGGSSRGLPPAVSGLATNPNNDGRLIVLSQQPDAVSLLDVGRKPQTSSLEDGTVTVNDAELAFAVLGAEAVAQSTLSDVVYIPRSVGDLVVVTSLSQDSLYFFDSSYSDLQLVHRMALPLGKGPIGVLHVQVDGQNYLLVSTFFDHGLTVIDISAPNATEFSVLTSFHDSLFQTAPRVR